MHGKDVVVEEILDRRPYDYVTDRTIIDTPGGPVRMLQVVELEPTADGTMIHIRFAPPRPSARSMPCGRWDPHTNRR
jgi:hypothetical protein